MVMYDPSPQNPKNLRPTTSSLKAFMNQPNDMVLVNSIIDKNKYTIMMNLQRNNVSTFGFGRALPPIGRDDPSHPLYGMFQPPIDPNDPFFDPRGAYQPNTRGSGHKYSINPTQFYHPTK